MRGILAGYLEQRAIASPGFKVSQTPPAYVDKWAGWDTSAGIDISPEIALQMTAVFACVRILAETIASLPLLTYARRASGGKERAVDHPLYRLLHDRPNPEMTSYTLRETLMGHLALRGNCYAEIEWGNGGQVLNLWPLRVDRMEDIRRENGRMVYYYRLPANVGGERKALDMSQVLHLRGLSDNGIVGYSPIQLARNAVALGMATEEYGARFFANGAQPGGVLEHPSKLGPEAYERLKTSWDKRHQGLSNAQRTAILEEGMKYHEISVAPEDAQFLETRKYQVTEIARLFKIPPHMIGDLDRATFSNIEHQSIEFVTITLGPWLVNWEQGLGRSLLTESESRKYFIEHLVAGLLRGDLASRYQAYAVGRQNGWLSANDIRELENMNPVEGGDVYLVPLNMVPADQVGAMPSAPAAPVQNNARRALPGAEQAVIKSPEERGRRSAKKRKKLVGVYRSLYEQTAERVLRREIADMKAAAKKYLQRSHIEQFNIWLSEYYDQHEEFVQTAFRPVNDAYGLIVGEEAASEIGFTDDLTEVLSGFLLSYVIAFAARHVGTSVNMTQNSLKKAIAGGTDLYQAIEEMCQHWLDVRVGMIAGEETIRVNNATAKQVYKRGGVIKLQWVAFGENCPYCSDLDGKVVGIEEDFLAADTDYKPDGAERPLRTAHNVGHAPAHDGCDCMVAAA